MNAGKSKKQLFAFSTPIEAFLDINEKFIVTWKDTNSIFYGINDLMSELTNVSVNGIVGKREKDIMPLKQATIIEQHDQEIVTSETTKTFIESAEFKNAKLPSWLCMKTPLYNNVDKMVGVFVLGFSLDKSNLWNISKTINNAKFNTLSSVLPPILMLPSSDSKAKLTKRQYECLYHLAHGRTAKEIARILFISPKTVEHHLEQVKVRLKCYTKSQLISKVWDEGFLN